jgi:two-component system, LytTR family, sensor kinase
MMRGIFIHHPLFRILFPALYGLLMYVLVLLVFDSIQQLEKNFFSQEALLCVALTYALFESLRWTLIGVNHLFPEFKSVRRRISIYLLSNLACSLVVISAGVSVYFVALLGYASFTIELITLNSLYLVTTFFYTLVYFGIFYLNHYNQRRLEQETALREKMEYQLGVLKSEVNPHLLYTSLETLITLVHCHPDEADAFIDCLSRIYRYSLEYRRHELAPLEQEIKAAENIVSLYNYSHQNLIHIHLQTETEVFDKQLIPGTMQKLMEHAISRSLITERHPLHLYVQVSQQEKLLLRYALHERLLPPLATAQLLADLQKAYGYFTDQPLDYSEDQDKVSIRVPFLKIRQPAQRVVSGE